MNRLSILIGTVLLSACSAKVPEAFPYKVVKKTTRSQILKGEELRLGVTEAKLSDTSYLIYAKLGSYSTMQRAQSMALYHAASLALQQGYQGFTLDQIQRNGWCVTERTRRTEMIQNTGGGVTTRLVVSLTNDSTAKKYKNASVAKKYHQQIINAPTSTEQLEKIGKQRTEQCLINSQKRTGRRLLNN